MTNLAEISHRATHAEVSFSKGDSAEETQVRGLWYLPATQDNVALCIRWFRGVSDGNFLVPDAVSQSACAVGVGLSPNESGFRLYFELNPGDGRPLYLGYKWSIDQQIRQDAYHRLEPLSAKAILDRFRRIEPHSAGWFGGLVDPRDDRVVASEITNIQRQSWLISLGNAAVSGQRRRQIWAHSVPPGQRSIVQERGLLHLAGGFDQRKGRFFTAYFQFDSRALKRLIYPQPSI